MKDSLTKRVRSLESKLPTAEDVQAQETRTLLGKLTIEELNTLHDIVERKENGIEPTAEEQAYADALRLKYDPALNARIERYRKHFAGEPVDLPDEEKRKLAEHEKYFAETESHERA